MQGPSHSSFRIPNDAFRIAAAAGGVVGLVVAAWWLGWPAGRECAALGALAVCASAVVAAADSSTRRREAAVLASLLGARLLLFVAQYDPATNWLHGDDFIRAWIAVKWADQPFLYTPDGDWLPLQFYVYGAVVPLLGGYLHLGLTALSQLFAGAAVGGVYVLARRLFSPRAAALAAALLTLTSWQMIVSLSCLAEPLYYTLTVWSIAVFLRWRDDDRLRQLVLLCVLLALLAATRYEGWIWLGLLCVPVAVKILRTPGRRARLGLLVVPCLVPLLWCAASWARQGTLLSHYDSNRDWFEQALGGLSLFVRLGVYPYALLCVSPTLVVVVLIALLVRRSAHPRAVAVLTAIVGLHFAALVAMYAAGTGPQFVERIVLVHYALLLPVAAALVCAGLPRLSRAAPLVVIVVVIGFGAVHLGHARHIFQSGSHSDHASVRHSYAALGQYLRRFRPHLRGTVVVEAVDPDGIIGTIAGLPRRVHAIDTLDDAPTLTAGRVEIFCTPTRDSGRGDSGSAVEAAFLIRNRGSRYHRTVVGLWHVYAIATVEQ